MVGEHVIRFEVNIDWRERHQMLKFELPTSVWSNKATYDTAFGVLERETYRNTSWEGAKFEGCGHKFVDCTYDPSVANYSVGIRLWSSADL
jgi:alpha-mannosidase